MHGDHLPLVPCSLLEQRSKSPWSIFGAHQPLKPVNFQCAATHAHHRLHDLRHAFIVRSAMRLYERDGVVECSLPALSIYVGHAKMVDTYWYFTGTPELMSLAAERFHRYVEGATR